MGYGGVPGSGSHFHHLSKSTNGVKEKWGAVGRGMGWREALKGARYQHAHMRRKSGEEAYVRASLQRSSSFAQGKLYRVHSVLRGDAEKEVSPDLMTEGAGTCGCEPLPDSSYHRHRLLAHSQKSLHRFYHHSFPP